LEFTFFAELEFISGKDDFLFYKIEYKN